MKKILIVDDSTFMRSIIREMISRKGLFKDSVEIFEADSRKSAIAAYRGNPLDLILLDIVMREGEREGIELLKEIRFSDTKIPVLMLTAIGQSATKDECDKLGVSGYLNKPIDETQLIKILGDLISG